MHIRGIVHIAIGLGFLGCSAGSIEMTHGGEVHQSAINTQSAGNYSGARATFESRVVPILDARCAGCHQKGRSGPSWYGTPSDRYTVMFGFASPRLGPLLDMVEPTQSAILNRGQHDGPALSSEESTTIAAWITEEKGERGAVNAVAVYPFMSAKIQPQGGAGGAANVIPLDSLSLPGATLNFTAYVLNGNLLAISNLRITAAAQRLCYDRPLLVRWNGDQPSEDVDRFRDIQNCVQPGQSQMIGNGTATVTGFVPGNQLSFAFDSIGVSP